MVVSPLLFQRRFGVPVGGWVVHTNNIHVKPNCQLSDRVGVELSVGLGFDKNRNYRAYSH